MFFIMYGYKSVWIRSLSDVEVRKSCIKEVFAFFGNLNHEKWHKYADFGVKYIFLLCKTAIIVIFVWRLMDFIIPLQPNTYFI